MTLVAKFEIHYNRFLNSEGEVVQELPDFAKNINTLIDTYRYMTLVRVFDTKAVALQRTGKMGTYAGILGQEAVSTAAGQVMRADDAFFPSYREYGAMLLRGVKMSDLFAYWGGDERGSDFANKDDFPLCVPIASQFLHATGTAYAFKYRKQDRVAVTMCGDGGTSKGDFYEALNLAGDWQLPVVFLINNNQWAISVPRSAQTHTQTLAQKAIAAGIPGEQVDGNDVIAVRYAVENAIAKARRGEGPTLIEAITYRLCDHTTADDAKRYRDDAEVEQAKREEPLIRLRAYLMKQDAWSDDAEKQLLQECSEKVEQAVQEYLDMPSQAPTAMLDYLYAELPIAYQDQWDEIAQMTVPVGH
ncbi:pyruvate dehydrogenase (acetyl-transferring) E1 component subunit alpha [soil metagenome]